MKDMNNGKDSNTHHEGIWGKSTASQKASSQSEADLFRQGSSNFHKERVKNRRRNQSDPHERQDYVCEDEGTAMEDSG